RASPLYSEPVASRSPRCFLVIPGIQLNSTPGSGELPPTVFHQPTQKEDPMDADQLKCKWVQFKGALKRRWGRFRDEHLVQTERSYDSLATKDKKDELMKRADQGHKQSAPDAAP